MADPVEQRIARFEQHFGSYLLAIARQLADQFLQNTGIFRDSGFFILSGVSWYFEAINQFLEGQDSRHKEKEFFRKGFRAVDPSSSASLTDVDIDDIYLWLRCGMYHGGMPQGNIHIHRGQTCSVHKALDWTIINPALLVDEICCHFTKYLTDLKNPASTGLRVPFNKRAEEIERSRLGSIDVAGTILSTTPGTPPPMTSGMPYPRP